MKKLVVKLSLLAALCGANAYGVLENNGGGGGNNPFPFCCSGPSGQCCAAAATCGWNADGTCHS